MDMKENLEKLAVSNISTTVATLTKRFFTKKDRGIITYIKKNNDELCRDVIIPGYVNQSLNKFTNGIVYLHNELVRGFVLWKETTTTEYSKDTSDTDIIPKKILEGLLICTKKNSIRIGEQLMRDVDMYARENKFYAITLIPRTKELLELYKRYGFEIYGFGVGDNRPNMRKLIQPVPTASIKETRKSRSHSRKRKRERIEYYNELLPKELQEEVNYKMMDDFFEKK
jgi:hypothetical protein